MTVVIAGATGNVGSEVLRAVLAAGGKARGLVRAEKQLPEGAEVAIGDLNDPASLADAFQGATAAFLLSGYADMTGLLAAVQRAGLERVVLLSGGSAELGDLSNAVSAYMVRSEVAVRESGVPFTILRPSMFMTNTLDWLPQLRESDVVRAAFPDVAAAVLDPADIGAVAATALLNTGHENRTYRLTGPEALTPADRVRILAGILGRDLRFEGLSNEAARAQMTAAMPVEYVDAFFSFYVDGTLDESPVLPTVTDILGRPPRTFREWGANPRRQLLLTLNARIRLLGVGVLGVGAAAHHAQHREAAGAEEPQDQ
ncbi:NmrA family NAD(P)-binding protein [Fodinicola feengrottensis]|uniref:NmrA family NAD(P)-binding protein n=1 Tax=Fodinicola feengrottensis TaxID=435914 RepID=UPI002441A6B6|nr:NmrA family NAD(P)-binding protein [Fodinicola feengrottensis]